VRFELSAAHAIAGERRATTSAAATTIAEPPTAPRSPPSWDTRGRAVVGADLPPPQALAELRLGDVQHERRGSSAGTASMASARATASPARYSRVFTVGSEVCERVGGIDQLAGIFLGE